MHIPLENRGLIKVDGIDARDFLQGLVSQDINQVTPSQAVYSALLSPQGKFLFDFFCFELDGALVLDCEADRRSDLFKRLSMFKLRSKVELSDITDDYQVSAVLIGSNAFGLKGADRGVAKPMGSGIAYTDPRLRAMGCRVALKKGDKALTFSGLTTDDFAEYERRRLTLGIADGSRDMSVDKALLLENGFEELNGVCFTKGCFMGQELTARTRYRGLVKKRLLPVRIDGTPPPTGSILMLGHDEVGEMKSHMGDIGVALVRVQHLKDGVSFHYGNTTLTPSVPDWVVLQKPKEDLDPR